MGHAENAERLLKQAEQNLKEMDFATATANALTGIGWAILALRKTVQYKV